MVVRAVKAAADVGRARDLAAKVETVVRAVTGKVVRVATADKAENVRSVPNNPAKPAEFNEYTDGSPLLPVCFISGMKYRRDSVPQGLSFVSTVTGGATGCG